MTGRMPLSVHAGGVEWCVTRAWPLAEGGVAVEVAADGVPSVRAGEWSASHGLRLQETGVDRRLPALVVHARRGAVISHRAGRRAVVRAADGSAYVKIVRPGRAAAVLAANAAAAGFGVSFQTAKLLRDPAAEGSGAVRFQALPGRTLHALGADPATTAGAWAQVWQAWAHAWRSLPAAPPGDALPSHGPEDEAVVLGSWAAHAARELPGAARAIHARADRLAAGLRRASATVALAHRDLHDKQLLWTGEGHPGLLDLDTACLADRALDLGNLRAHAVLRAAQGVWPGAFADAAVACVDEVGADVGVPPERMRIADAAARFRLGCVYLFRPRWRELAVRWLGLG